MFCPKCGQKNAEEALYCIFCGERISTRGPSGSMLSEIATEELVKQASIVPLVSPATQTAPRALQDKRYSIIRELGEGGMGKVFLARDEKMEFDVVVKEMLPYLATPKEREYIKKHFKEEAKMLFRLKHQGLPRVTDYFFEGNSIYIIMEFINGEDLESIIKSRPDSRISIEEFFRWITKVLTILQYLHTQVPPIIHRDIKPGNIMVTNTNDIILVDFGVAKSVGMKTGTHTRVGTPGFASPEHFFGKFFLSSDIYSLGATFHYLLTGDDPRSRNPFDYPPLEQYRNDTPQGMQKVLDKMLETEIDQRYASSESVLEDLNKLIARHFPQMAAEMSSSGSSSASTASSSSPESGQDGSSIKIAPAAFTGSANWKKLYDVLFESSICCISFSPTGKYAACGTGSNDVKIIDAESGEFVDSYVGHVDWVRAVSFSPDGLHVVSGSDDKTIKAWNVETGKCIKDLQGHADWVRGIAYSPDGSYFVTGSYDCKLKIWSTRSWSAMVVIEEVIEAINTVDFSPNGRVVASGSDDSIAYIWHARSGDLLKKLEGHESYIYALKFSPDGNHLATGSGDQKVKIWDTNTGAVVQTLEGHTNSIFSLGFSPDGKRLVSGSDDKTIRVWTLDDGKCEAVLESHSHSIYGVGFTMDGTKLLSCSGDKSIIVWSAQ